MLLKGNKLDASGLTGNLVPEGTSFGEQVFAGVAGNVGIDVIKAKFSGPASGITSLIGL